MRMAREALSGGDARLARTVPLWERGDADGRAAVERVNASLSGLMPFDVSLIGMGMDGHTASIFPNGAGMDHARSAPGPFCATEPDPLPDEAPWPRITATLPALTQVRAQHLMLFGAEKAGVFRKLVETELSSPIAVLVKSSEERLTAHFCV
jgi:6-phosphogluconolactonase